MKMKAFLFIGVLVVSFAIGMAITLSIIAIVMAWNPIIGLTIIIAIVILGLIYYRRNRAAIKEWINNDFSD